MKKGHPLATSGGGSEASVFASAQIIDKVLRRLPAVRLGKRILIPAAGLREWFERATAQEGVAGHGQ